MHRERVHDGAESRGAGPLPVAGDLHARVRRTAPLGHAPEIKAEMHNPHGGGNPCDLEMALDQDLLITSVGWANSYYGEGAEYVDEWGISWVSAPYETPYGRGRYTEPRGRPLAGADAKAVARYQPPDPSRPELYKDAERLIAEYRAEYWIVGSTVTTIFETAWALRGLEQLLTDFIEDPDLADAILDIPYRYHLAAAETLVRMGVDMIWLGDDVGHQHGMFISPRHWRRFLKPRMAHIIERLKTDQPGREGRVPHGRLRLSGHPGADRDRARRAQPDPARRDGPRQGQARVRQGPLLLGLDRRAAHPAVRRPDDVRREVLDRIATLGAGGGLILAPTHHVQLDTPLENFWAMVEAVTRSGVMTR